MPTPLERSGLLWVPSRRDILRGAGGVVAAGLLAPKCTQAALTRTDQANGYLGPSPPGTLTINSTGANLLVAGVVAWSSYPASILSDSKGNSWTGLTAKVMSNIWMRIYYCANPVSVGTNHGLTFTAAGSYYASAMLAAYSGAPGSPLDGESGATGDGVTAVQPGPINLTAATELVISAGQSNNGTVLSLDGAAGMTLFPGSSMFAEKLDAGPGEFNPKWNASYSCQMASVMAAFKPNLTSSRIRHSVRGGE